MHEVWPGSQEEAHALTAAVMRNCVCSYGVMGVRLTTCPPHAMLLDPDAVKHLLFLRSLRDQLNAEEGVPPDEC